jgi:hypothetical protein
MPYVSRVVSVMRAVLDAAGFDQSSLSAQTVRSSLWFGQIQDPDGDSPISPISCLEYIPRWATTHHISSVMYTTAMQQLEGSRALNDWEPVEQVGKCIPARTVYRVH